MVPLLAYVPHSPIHLCACSSFSLRRLDQDPAADLSSYLGRQQAVLMFDFMTAVVYERRYRRRRLLLTLTSTSASTFPAPQLRCRFMTSPEHTRHGHLNASLDYCWRFLAIVRPRYQGCGRYGVGLQLAVPDLGVPWEGMGANNFRWPLRPW